jgi:hypothetical protein
MAQVYDNRKGLGGTRQHLVGESDFDLSQLVLDGMPQTRWCRLEHPDLKAAVEEIDKRSVQQGRLLCLALSCFVLFCFVLLISLNSI